MNRLAAFACVIAVSLAGCGDSTEDHGGEDGENTRTAAGTPAPAVTPGPGAAAPNIAELRARPAPTAAGA